MPGENLAFTERAISKFQRMSPTDPLAAPIVEYLIRLGRLFIGPGDLYWIIMPNGPAQVAVPLVPIEDNSHAE